MQKENLKQLIDQSLEQRPWLFLLDFSMSHDGQIKIVLDGDQSVSVNDCVDISRELEQELEREMEDFSLEVTSAGLSTPLTLPRQFKKNIGRKLSVKTENKNYKADLLTADDEGIELQWKQREPKPVGKGKHTVTKKVKLNYNEIEEAKVVITFK